MQRLAQQGGLRLVQNVMALDDDVALRGGQISGDDVHGGGLAGAVWPQKAEDLTVSHRKAQVIHGIVIPVPLYQIFYFDQTENLLMGAKGYGPFNHRFIMIPAA